MSCRSAKECSQESAWFGGALFGFFHRAEDFLRSFYGEQGGSQFRIAEDAAETGEHRQVVGEARRSNEEQNLDWFVVERAERNSGAVAAEDQDGAFQKAAHGIARVRESDAVADRGGVKAFALEQGVEEEFLVAGFLAHFGDQFDQFLEHGGFVSAAQMQLNLLEAEQFR